MWPAVMAVNKNKRGMAIFEYMGMLVLLQHDVTKRTFDKNVQHSSS